MPEPDKDLNIERTTKIPFDPADIDLTQKIDINYEEIINESKKKALLPGKNKKQESVTASLTGKSLFTRKRITDDYVKSSSILSTIDSIPPLKDKLELQDVNDNYELKDQFSEGAQGIIRTAFDKSLKRDIVVKSLKSDDAEEQSREDESLFVSEARIMAQLDHPSIIPLYGLHCGAESKLHLAMKHIHGKNLHKYLQDVATLYKREGIGNFDEKRSMATRIEYFLKVCEAVDYAHCKGVIHRDLKPENIMIGNYGEVYVMDWGLACLVKTDEMSDVKHLSDISEHSKNALVGTPRYIAPELIKGELCSPQSDIFSLGVILFEIITLKPAVPGKTIKEVFKNILSGNYSPFKHCFLKARLSTDLKSIINKAVCANPSQRYESADDMAKDLKLYLMHEETMARPDNIFRKCIRGMINYKMVTFIVILSVLLCLAASTIYSLLSQNALMKEQEIRETMLTSFQANVSRRANEMERIFFYFKTQLKNLGYRAGCLLSSKASASVRVYGVGDYRKASTAPSDCTYSPAYGEKISLDSSVFKPGPGVKLTDEISKRVFALQPMLKHIMLTSDPAFKNKTKNYIRKTIIDKGVSLNWVYIGLTNGSILCYPGGDIYLKGYDPRKRPWYKKALTQKHSMIWSEPYQDAFSSKIVMTCSRRVYDKEDKFQGVVGMDISLDYIQKRMFGNKALPGLKEYLLNKQGRIILSSDFKDKKTKTHQGNATLTLKEFPFLKEFEEAVEQEMVQFEAVRYKTKYIFALNQLPSLGYYYIQQISEKRLYKSWQNKTSYKKK
jgi:eukaryotic-like serine/threonine-protein kinase